MTPVSWLDRLKKAEKIGVIADGKRKIHYKLEEGLEMVEEYSLDTNVLVRRAWRDRRKLCGNHQWAVEVGDPEPQTNSLDAVGIKEDVNSPYVTMRITKSSLEWRIRNLPYPLDMYSVTADPENKCITVRTSNKKYFKKLLVPDLERAGVSVQQSRIQYTHKYNTLVVTYEKPPELLQLEKLVFEEVKKVKTRKEDDPQCNPS
ncbi:protein DPCD [Schistocerca cancellata]|uniref:protein DPCD n=1 Tax=Schistocerca cancellata TaxID=274614 RepID=UPI002117790D|nr:protein DPCD [Schistocerca cancellata]